jgi:3-hydroxyisobutyrate dehydrogenase-like beta-hydroxyacid dehydrogenase
VAIAQYSNKERVGVIGLGAMGGPIARNLLISGQRVIGYDIDEQRRNAFLESGGTPARTMEELVRGAAVVFTALPDPETFIDVAETRLVPHAQKGQTVVDVGTVGPRQVRRFARMFARKGAALLDAPVSGGPAGAEAATLRVFVGGDPDTYKKMRPLLEVIGDKDRITYCGPSGAGQTVKGVSQLAMGLTNAALLEAIAYGVNGGLKVETLREALSGDEGWRKMLAELCEKVAKHEGDGVGIKWGQYMMFMEEAAEKGFPMPATTALQYFLRNSEMIVPEGNRKTPSLWHELTAGAAASRAASRA